MTDVDARARELYYAMAYSGSMSQELWVPIIAAALTEYGEELQSKLAAAEARVKELEGALHQLGLEAYMRADYKRADEVASILGETLPTVPEGANNE